jgi:hypothetical protein
MPQPLEEQHQYGIGRWGLPERRLMLALLLDAVAEFARGGRRAAEVARWIRAEDGHATPVMFEDVCAALALDPVYVGRHLLNEMTARSYDHRRLHRPRARGHVAAAPQGH